jgi:flagellar hook-associated protein 3 FlgL
MLTRIGDRAQASQLTSTLLATQSRMRDTQNSVATGKAAAHYDAISDQANLLLRTKDSRQLTATYQEQNEQLGDRLRVMDGALGSMLDIVERARTLLVQRLDGSVGSSVPLDAEAEGMLEAVAAQLNTRFDGQYLFAGSRSDQPAVQLPATPITAADPTLYYQGDDVELTVRADAEVEIAYGVTAAEPGFASLIAGLGQALTAHAANDRAGLQAAAAQLDTALSEITTLRSELGAKTARLEAINEGHGASLVYLDEIVSRIEDTDLPAALTSLAQDRANLEATYMITGQLAGLSLADYLR